MQLTATSFTKMPHGCEGPETDNNLNSIQVTAYNVFPFLLNSNSTTVLKCLLCDF